MGGGYLSFLPWQGLARLACEGAGRREGGRGEDKDHRKIHTVIKCAECVIVRTAQISYENIKEPRGRDRSRDGMGWGKGVGGGGGGGGGGLGWSRGLRAEGIYPFPENFPCNAAISRFPSPYCDY